MAPSCRPRPRKPMAHSRPAFARMLRPQPICPIEARPSRQRVWGDVRLSSEIGQLIPAASRRAIGRRAIFDAERDPRFVQIVRTHLHLHPISGRDLDVVLAELSGNVSEDNVAVRQFDAKHRPGQHGDDLSFYFDRVWVLSRIGRECRIQPTTKRPERRECKAAPQFSLSWGKSPRFVGVLFIAPAPPRCSPFAERMGPV
jgi:hypothetical protein